MNKYIEYLKKEGFSNNTISSYITTLQQYLDKYKTINLNNLLLFKEDLINNYKPKSVNAKILGINKYLIYKNKADLKLKCIKLQRNNYLDNVISYADYLFLINKLKHDNNYKWYYIIKYFALTGARVSELIKFKIEDLKLGYIDIYSKGNKIRRIYIPNRLVKETNKWLNNINRSSGYLFINRYNKPLTTRGIASELKLIAKRYDMNLNVIYPHSFRHMFAKKFLEKCHDLVLLSDLLGHCSIETTKIYLQRTSNEQQAIIDKVVDW